MKKNKPILLKVRSLTNSNIYYTYSNWESKEIEGVVFIPVVRDEPTGALQHTFWVRKENMEFL